MINKSRDVEFDAFIVIGAIVGTMLIILLALMFVEQGGVNEDNQGNVVRESV